MDEARYFPKVSRSEFAVSDREIHLMYRSKVRVYDPIHFVWRDVLHASKNIYRSKELLVNGEVDFLANFMAECHITSVLKNAINVVNAKKSVYPESETQVMEQNRINDCNDGELKGIDYGQA